MANSISAKKRIKISKKKHFQNLYYKKSAKTLSKQFFKNLEKHTVEKSSEIKKNLIKNLNSFYSIIDKGTRKSVFHKRKAAKKKANLASYLKKL